MIMADGETELWIKNQLVAQAQGQSTILGKLEQGEQRMGRMEETLTEVVETTREFPALKFSVEEIKAEEDRRKKEKQATLELQIAEMKEQKALWGQRLWELFVKALPFILVAIMFIYSQIKDTL